MRSNAELIEAVLKQKDAQAFEQIVLRFEKLIWTVVWDVVRDFHATQDITQETFLVAYQKLAGLRSPETIAAWLAQIARRRALQYRKQTVKFETREFSEHATRLVGTKDTEQHLELLDLLAALPEQERSVLVLKHIDGHDSRAIADLLGRPIGTVTKQLSRGMKTLREQAQRQGQRSDYLDSAHNLGTNK